MKSPAAGQAAVLACMMIVLSGCQTAPSATPDASAPLDAAALTATLQANSLYRRGGPFWRRWQFTSVHAADGTMRGRVWWSRGEQTATGTWEIDADGLYCRTWSNDWGAGKRGCFRVARAGETLSFEFISGARGDADRYVYELRAGNPFDL